MTQITTPAVQRTDVTVSSFVEWSAVLSGAILAAALSFVLLTFGAAIGLSATSPWPNNGLSVKVIASVAVFWAMAQQIGSVMVGGYVAGRMRSRWHEGGYEAEFRDGLHGALVWAIAVLIGALLIFTTAGVAARSGADAATKAVSSLTRPSSAIDTMLDTMLRSTVPVQAATPSPPTAGAPPTTGPAPIAGGRRAADTSGADDTRAEISHILTGSVASGSNANDRTYLAQIVAQRTGVTQQEAEQRVDDAVNAVRAAADKARHAAILTGFVTAAALILSLATGWWAAMRGGQHRDTSVPARFTFGDRRRAPVT